MQFARDRLPCHPRHANLFPALTAALALIPACGDSAPGTTNAIDGGSGSEAGAKNQTVAFTVTTDQGLWKISPEIYGVNLPTPSMQLDPTMRAGNVRAGGNRSTAYNWENNASNAGTDYRNQNDGYLGASNTPGYLASATWTQATGMGASTLITVPMGDYVAADKSPSGDVNLSAGGGSDGGCGSADGGCGGDSYLTTRFKKNVAAKGAPFADTPDTTDDSIYEDEYIAWIKGHAPTAPVSFALDNEPDLWSQTHPRIHPIPVTYAEMVERTTRFSTAIKNVWPEAPILSFVSYGWNGFVTLQNASDRAGNGQFWDYFLAKMRSASEAQGRRLIDYLDLHWYPEAKGGGVRIVTAGAPATAENIAAWEDARLQAPRSLWDPTYLESSWITGSGTGPIDLIHRVMTKIQTNYPGTKLAITEWNYGGGGDITGAIATADVLGIFGREGVSLANIWWVASSEPFTIAGMKAFRNFDGQAGSFGDTAIAATNSDTVNTSIYASLQSSNPGHVVVVAINKQKDVTVTAAIKLAHPGTFSQAKTYVLLGSSPAFQAGQDVVGGAANAFTYAMPPRSVSVLVFDGTLPAAGWQPTIAATPPQYASIPLPDAATPADTRVTSPVDVASEAGATIDTAPADVSARVDGGVVLDAIAAQ
jgi:hypothetical protein